DEDAVRRVSRQWHARLARVRSAASRRGSGLRPSVLESPWPRSNRLHIGSTCRGRSALDPILRESKGRGRSEIRRGGRQTDEQQSVRARTNLPSQKLRWLRGRFLKLSTISHHPW